MDKKFQSQITFLGHLLGEYAGDVGFSYRRQLRGQGADQEEYYRLTCKYANNDREANKTDAAFLREVLSNDNNPAAAALLHADRWKLQRPAATGQRGAAFAPGPWAAGYRPEHGPRVMNCLNSNQRNRGSYYQLTQSQTLKLLFTCLSHGFFDFPMGAAPHPRGSL